MDGNQGHPHPVNNGGLLADGSSEADALISVAHIQRLVRLLDQSDVSEVELKQADTGTRLVLRKAQAPQNNAQSGDTLLQSGFMQAVAEQAATSAHEDGEARHIITAHLVGIFHAWAKPRGGTLVALGDRVKVGQLVATIESLNVSNEVESMFAGRVIEILVQEGQPVEYGQHLMVLDGAAEKEGA